MPYVSGKFPPSWKNLDDGVRAEAVKILNALLKGGMDEGKAIPTALSRARQFVRNHSMMTKAEWMAKCKKDHPNMKPAEMKAWVEKMMKTEDMKDKGVDEAKEMAVNSNVIKGVEIFSTGTHNGDAYAESDLDEMVRAHAALDFRPAIKVGHTKDAPGAPAYGWVQNLRRVGQKLVADFTDMHDSVVEALRKRSYDRVSSEVYFNLNRGGKTFKRALKAVALLGADVPAVAGLKPIHKMEFAATGEFEKFTAHEDALDVSPQAVFDCLSERMSALIQHYSSEDIDMKTKAQELQDRLDELTVKLNAIGEDGADDKAKGEQIKKLSADIEAVTTEIKLLTQVDADERSKMAETIKANNARIEQLEADARRRSVAEKVATVKVPAFRPGMEAMYAYALTHAAEKVRIYAKDKDGKEVSVEQTLVDIADGFVTHINSQAEKLFKAYSTARVQMREEGSDTPNEDAGVELDRKVKEYIAKHPEIKGDYLAAVQAVNAADPDLARRYSEQASVRASAH